MSGSPTLAEIQTMWDNVVRALEHQRQQGDVKLLSILDDIEQAVEGDFTPQGLTGWTQGLRAAYSSLIDTPRARSGHQPVLYEYAKFIDSPYQELRFVFRDIYDYMHDNNLIVPSRNITFGAPAYTAPSGGDGILTRLTRDWNDYDTEACRPELKRLVCRNDQNSGAQRNAEVFELKGIQASIDAMNLLETGTGPLGTMTSHHAGSGAGGSLLQNSSFSDWNGTTFPGWESVIGAPTQDLANVYRSYPGASVDASLQTNGAAKVWQYISTRVRRLNPDLPYFFRAMYNATINGASGPLVISIGNLGTTIADVSLSPPGWNEIIVPVDKDAWFRNFNIENLFVNIDYQGAGNLVIDDVLFSPYDYFDGTFWFLRGGQTPWLVDDAIEVVDTGGDPSSDGMRNYWTYLAGLGYLPNDSRGAAVTWGDPTI